MKLYLAGGGPDPFHPTMAKLINLLLISFAMVKSFQDFGGWLMLAKCKPMSLFIDSGAYSVATRGETISLHGYCQFLVNNIVGLPDTVYANLDVIGSPEKTYRNQIYMESSGLSPLPTFHYGSPYDLLDEMVKTYPYIGLGGLVPLASSKAKLFGHLREAFNIIRLKTKVHGWGMTAPDVLASFPFYSVDSTSWLAGQKSNKGLLFNPLTMSISETKDRNKYISTLHWSQKSIENAKQQLKMIQTITRIWESRGITCSSYGNPG